MIDGATYAWTTTSSVNVASNTSIADWTIPANTLTASTAVTFTVTATLATSLTYVGVVTVNPASGTCPIIPDGTLAITGTSVTTGGNCGTYTAVYTAGDVAAVSYAWALTSNTAAGADIATYTSAVTTFNGITAVTPNTIDGTLLKVGNTYTVTGTITNAAGD